MLLHEFIYVFGYRSYMYSSGTENGYLTATMDRANPSDKPVEAQARDINDLTTSSSEGQLPSCRRL
jgi:hypothetical protein